MSVLVHVQKLRPHFQIPFSITLRVGLNSSKSSNLKILDTRSKLLLQLPSVFSETKYIHHIDLLDKILDFLLLTILKAFESLDA